jgi:hypothetical protein
MARNSAKVHVVRVTKTGYVDKQGRRKVYSSAYLRRTYREAGKVKNETAASPKTGPWLGRRQRPAARSRRRLFPGGLARGGDR